MSSTRNMRKGILSQELSSELYCGSTCRSSISTSASLPQRHSGCSLLGWCLSSSGRSDFPSAHDCSRCTTQPATNRVCPESTSCLIHADACEALEPLESSQAWSSHLSADFEARNSPGLTRASSLLVMIIGLCIIENQWSAWIVIVLCMALTPDAWDG